MNEIGEQGVGNEAARKRAAVEIVARHEVTLRRTARRYSLCAEDAEDAYQRALEILLLKAPTTDQRELIRWMQTVTKHEALAVRRSREQLLGRAPALADRDGEPIDWVALIPAGGRGPAERVEELESVARSREAMKTLKPAELRALSLLAEGYSYAEIAEITGFSRTKVNRCLAEGRERFRRFIVRSEEGDRCAELRPLLSAFCDGEAAPEEVGIVREHLRACGHCRATMRAYRTTPGTVAALLPALSAAGLLARLRDLFAGAKGTAGAGMAKGLAVGTGAVGCATVALTGVGPGLPGLSTEHPSVGNSGAAAVRSAAVRGTEPSSRRADTDTRRARKPRSHRPEQLARPDPTRQVSPSPAQAPLPAAASAPPASPTPVPPTPAPVPSAPAPEPAPSPNPAGPSTSQGSAAGEFGP